MTRRSTPARLLAFTVALVGLALVAVGVRTPAHAQSTTTSTQAPPDLECDGETQGGDDLVIQYCRPQGAVSSSPSVPIRIDVRNIRTTVGQTFDVTGISAEVVPTLPDQAVPTGGARAEQKSDPAASLALEPTFTTNGVYDVRVTATGGPDVRRQRATATFSIGLAVLPRPPADVEAERLRDGSILISWSKEGREPDTLYYDVRRAPESGSTFTSVDVVDATAAARHVDDPGKGSWRYRVLAVRRGAAVGQELTTSSVTTTPIEIAAATTSSTPEGGASSGGGGTTGGVGGSTSGSTSTTRPAVTAGSRPGVSLGTITTTADGRRTVTTVRRVERDPGFQETLPFNVPPTRPEAPPAEEALELGTEDDQAAGQELVIDEAGERRQSLGFVAGGLLLFVLGMTGLFVKSEVRRADELDGLDAIPATETPAPGTSVPAAPVVAAAAAPTRTRSRVPRRGLGADAAVPVAAVAVAALPPVPVAERPEAVAPSAPEAVPVSPAPVVMPPRRRLRTEARAQRADELATMFGPAPDVDDDERHLAELATALQPAVPATRSVGRRLRRTVAPADAPDLDVPDPAAPAPTSSRTSPPPTTRTRTTDRARRAPTRLPSRPADDRREGGAAVRPRRRGTGQGDRRLPVG